MSGSNALITAIVLLAAIVYVLMSILGVEITLVGRRVIPLSRTMQTGGGYSDTSGHFGTQAGNAYVGQMSRPEQWETVRMRVTAYCPCKRCCGKYADGRTACSHKIRAGDVFVAADKKLRFGTEIIVPWYNAGSAVKVMDRGGVIKGNRLDVFFNSHKQARKWGVKYLDVKIKKG